MRRTGPSDARSPSTGRTGLPVRARPGVGIAAALSVALAVAGWLAAGTVLAEPSGTASAADRVEREIGRTRPKKGRYAVGVWDVASGERLVARHADRPLRPASVMKLATTAAALLRLGPDDAFTTDVHADWESRGSGRVPVALTVVGTGDPGLSGRFHDGVVEAPLRDLARQVARAGIREVDGDLVLDVSSFSGPERHPSWGWKPGANEWWRAPVTALIVNDNCQDFSVLPGPRPGTPAQVSISPETSEVRFANRLVTVAKRSEHSIRVLGPDRDGRIPLAGGVLVKSAGYTKPLVLGDPVAVFGDVFRRLLREEGVRVRGETHIVGRGREGTSGARVSADPSRGVRRTRVARHATSVVRVVDVSNTRSQNLFSEVLLRRLGSRFGKTGSFSEGARVVRDVLGIPARDGSFVQVDGSGLSRDNRVTADRMGKILLRMYASPHRMDFMGSLAIGGDPDGTLRKRFRGDRFEGRVRAKTGTIRSTSALAGYVRGHDDRVYAFVVLGEGEVGGLRKLQDAVVGALVGQ